MRLLHTSDWQLGMTRHFLEGEAQARFSEARLAAITRLGELAAAHDCVAVVVAGDVFETSQPDARTVARALERLGRLPCPVYLLPGNHDPDEPGAVWRTRAFGEDRPDNVHVLDDTPQTPVEGLEIRGAPWRSKHPTTDLTVEVCAASPDDGARRVVVGHGSIAEVSGGFDAPGTIDLQQLQAHLDAGRVRYVALGDRHSCTSVDPAGRVWYSGAPEPTAYTEVDAGTALLVDLTDATPAVTRLAVGTWRFHRIHHAVHGDDDLAALATTLDAIEDPSQAIVKLSLEGTLDLRQAARLEQLLEERRLTFGALEQPERHRDVAVRTSDADLTDLPLRGYAAVARDRLAATAAGDGEDAEVARDALGLLLRLTDREGR